MRALALLLMLPGAAWPCSPAIEVITGITPQSEQVDGDPRILTIEQFLQEGESYLEREDGLRAELEALWVEESGWATYRYFAPAEALPPGEWRYRHSSEPDDQHPGFTVVEDLGHGPPPATPEIEWARASLGVPPEELGCSSCGCPSKHSHELTVQGDYSWLRIVHERPGGDVELIRLRPTDQHAAADPKRLNFSADETGCLSVTAIDVYGREAEPWTRCVPHRCDTVVERGWRFEDLPACEGATGDAGLAEDEEDAIERGCECNQADPSALLLLLLALRRRRDPQAG